MLRLAVGALALVSLPALAQADVDVSVDVGVHVDVSIGSEPPPPPQPVNVYVETPVTVAINQPVIAEPVIYDELPEPRTPRRALTGNLFEAGVGLDAGSFSYDDIGGGQVGIRGDLGIQLGRLRLGVEGSLAKFSGSRDLYDDMGWWDGWEDKSGEIKRTGLSARFLVGALEAYAPPFLAAGFYVEGGIGRQIISFDGGGSRTRDDVMGGLGIEIGGGQRRHGAMDLGVRVLATQSMSRTDDTHDLAFLFHFGAIFGT
jgi:hypothetical protein